MKLCFDDMTTRQRHSKIRRMNGNAGYLNQEKGPRTKEYAGLLLFNQSVAI